MGNGNSARGARVLQLVRTEPGPGQLGGLIAEAVVFSDGPAVLHWLTAPAVTEFYPSEEAMRAVREHAGRSAFYEDSGAAVRVPDGVSYAVSVVTDEHGASDPGRTQQLLPVRTMAEGVAELRAAAAAGCEYACLELTRDTPAPVPAAGPAGNGEA